MRLLTHTVRKYFLLSVIMLFLSVPVFYFLIQGLLINALDEELRDHRNDFYKSMPILKTEADITFYSMLNEEFILHKVDHKITNDSLYTQEMYDSAKAMMVPYRIFRSGVYLNNQHYALLIRESLIGTRELILVIVMVKAGVLTALLIGLIFVNRRITKTVWQPFYQTLQKLKEYEIDKNSSVSLTKTSVTEFNDLNQAIVQLLEQSHQIFLNQKEFTENAAHELQTPLAICRTKLELLIQTNELTNEQADLVSSLYEAIERLTRLNRNLLLLSKIENRQFIEQDTLSIGQLITQLLNDHEERIAERNLNLVKVISSDVTIEANRTLVEVLINNLLLNAIAYTPTGETIVINLTHRTIEIANEGMPLERPEKIFERFHREAKTQHGSGLGLPIVKKICEINNYGIAYMYKDGKHHFTVNF